MGVVKKVVKGVGGLVGGILGGGQKAPKLETKVPAQQLERQTEVGAEDIQIGSDDLDTTQAAKGKRGLVRPVASSLGGV